jgi:hypothetical protein
VEKPWLNRLAKLWRQLPWDGQGLLAPSDVELAGLRRRAAARFWRRVPGWSRPLLSPAARLLWGAAAALRTGRFARAHRLEPGEALRLLVDSLGSGADPVDAWVWHHLFPDCPRHPLPGRAAALLLSALGEPAQHRLLVDKQATAARLAEAGLAVPRLLAEIGSGTPFEPLAPPWSEPRRLFVKPRHGAAGRGCAAIDVFAPGVYRIGAGVPVGPDALRAWLEAGAARDTLLVQERLAPHPDLADLAGSGGPPVLRLTIARRPGEPPFLHSALVSVAVPGALPHDFLRGHVYSPLDPAGGAMAWGVRFRAPGERFERLPWNDAPLTGRVPPGFDRATAMALKAMSLFPDLALVNWDIIPTPDGPVILEGNTNGNWTLTRLGATAGLETEPLVPLLGTWAERSPQRHFARSDREHPKGG